MSIWAPELDGAEVGSAGGVIAEERHRDGVGAGSHSLPCAGCCGARCRAPVFGLDDASTDGVGLQRLQRGQSGPVDVHDPGADELAGAIAGAAAAVRRCRHRAERDAGKRDEYDRAKRPSPSPRSAVRDGGGISFMSSPRVRFRNGSMPSGASGVYAVAAPARAGGACGPGLTACAALVGGTDWCALRVPSLHASSGSDWTSAAVGTDPAEAITNESAMLRACAPERGRRHLVERVLHGSSCLLYVAGAKGAGP